MAAAIRYIVTCCQGPVDGGEIADNRPIGGDVEIDPENSFRVATAAFYCEAAGCTQGWVRLGRRELGELLDAICLLQDSIGHTEMLDEGRRVIPLGQLVAVNGKLQRRKTAPRRRDVR